MSKWGEAACALTSLGRSGLLAVLGVCDGDGVRLKLTSHGNNHHGMPYNLVLDSSKTRLPLCPGWPDVRACWRFGWDTIHACYSGTS